MNKNIIIAILVVIIIAVVAAFALTHQQPATTEDGKLNTQINFLSKDTLKNGEQIQFELKDAQGTALAGQNVNISYIGSDGKNQTYSIYTDNSGKGFLAIQGEDPGKYDVTVSYGGNDKYNGCTAKQTITVEEGAAEAAPAETSANSTANTIAYNNGTSQATNSSQSTSSQSYYDADLNVYFDQNGKVIGGQSAGQDIWELRNNPPVIDESGSLV